MSKKIFKRIKLSDLQYLMSGVKIFENKNTTELIRLLQKMNENNTAPKNSSMAYEWIGATYEFDRKEGSTLNIPGYWESSLSYIENEKVWHESMDLSIKGYKGIENNPTWSSICSSDFRVNSNYGWAIYSEENHNQYEEVLKKLKADPDSRQAVMYYTRPTMHKESIENGRRDMMCTMQTQVLIRNDKLYYKVYMRSNDFFYGLFNNYAWHCQVIDKLQKDLGGIELGKIFWTAGSLHIYKELIDYEN